MRFTILINQPKAIEWGLNLPEAAIFQFFYELPSWADKINIGNETFYYAAKSKISNEIPLVTTKPDTTYRHVKKLKEKGLINTIKIENKDYVCITEKGKTWNMHEHGSKSDRSEKNPSDVGKKSENDSEKNPTYNNTNSISKPNYNINRTKRFIKPTIDEVKAYCTERKNNVNPEKWYNHYTSNGWKVGKNPMRDWKAAVRTWENNSFGNNEQQNLFNQSQNTAPVSNYENESLT